VLFKTGLTVYQD